MGRRNPLIVIETENKLLSRREFSSGNAAQIATFSNFVYSVQFVKIIFNTL